MLVSGKLLLGSVCKVIEPVSISEQSSKSLSNNLMVFVLCVLVKVG